MTNESEIMDTRLYALGGEELNDYDKVKNHFTITLKSKERQVDENLCYFCDTRNKIGNKATELKQLVGQKAKKRLIIFSFKNKDETAARIYADAIMFDDGNRFPQKYRNKDGDVEEYPCSYLLEVDSIRFFEKGIPLEAVQDILAGAKGQQSAVKLGKDMTEEQRLASIKTYLEKSEEFIKNK